MSDRSGSLCAALSLMGLAVSFSFLFSPTAHADHTPDPVSVTVAGSFQDELGCPGDWQPDCIATHIAFDAEDAVWQGTFNIPAGSWEYKGALNDSWDENYGAGGVQNGPLIGLALATVTDVKFYYSHETHWITDDVTSVIAVAPGDFQSELGCSGDWDPACLRSWLQDPDGDGVFTFITHQLPAGGYQVKVALDESWDVNYGAGGVQNGPTIPFTVPADCTPMMFAWDFATKILTVSPAPSAAQPASVTIAGSLQDELGCPGDWQPDCAVTHLTFDADDAVWQGTFNIPAGSWEYKGALDDSWDVNYGAGGIQNGPNIPLSLGAATDVKFYYSHTSHWVTDNQNSIIATVPGSFQSELGCAGDWDPACLRTWLEDLDGDGVFTFSTSALPAGNYEAKVAIDESWDVNYGAGGVLNGPNIPFTVASSCTEIFFSWDSDSHILTIGGGPPPGDLALARAHWLAEDLLAWDSTAAAVAATVQLHGAPSGGMSLAPDGVQGAAASLTLTPDPAGIPAGIAAKFPHLAGYDAYRIAAADLPQVPALLMGQLAVSALDGASSLVDATSIQIPGVLDDLYNTSEVLGVVLDAATPTLRVWAPTAVDVQLNLFADSDPATSAVVVPMTRDAATGVWSVTGDGSWLGLFYLYEVQVYAPSTGQVETNLVTDPYSISLAADSTRSQIVDLADPSLKPAGWDGLAKPALEAPEDVVIYELHVRDFSIFDESVSAAHRGRYRAFTETSADGMQHLAALAAAGLSHVTILPAADLATVPERIADQSNPDPAVLAAFPPDSDQQQALIALTEDVDGFNWGYDPWHFTVPDGAYATDPDGPQRILEFREMVQTLSDAGLRVVMDVVFNHTYAAGQGQRSVLDRIVPGYYHRLNGDGQIETSTCCSNTASEHLMMEKLMMDSLVTWATAYKVDGFRFDLMGHHMVSNMELFRDTLHALTVGNDGVDGAAIYLYGEGWNFGEVANDARGVNATQMNLAGTGIGTFNDRIRDSARGGSPFGGVQDQGFATGLWFDPNVTNQGTPAEQLDRLLLLADRIRVSLAGNLRNFSFEDRNGVIVTGQQVDYNGLPAGYTVDPQEIINYVSAHDYETFFDAVQLKAPVPTAMSDRVRMQNLGLDIVLLGQGVPLLHAGSDMLRSKSMDRDSYNAGDWFNAIDFSYTDSGWGHGLPNAAKNQDKWPLMQPLLANPALAPAPADIQSASQHAREVLAIRRSSPLFRLRTEADISASVTFLNTGPAQIPGLIAMALTPTGPVRDLDPNQGDVVVVFNASDDPASVTSAGHVEGRLALHPVLQASSDPIVQGAAFDRATGTFDVPARTTAVFVTGTGFQVEQSATEIPEPNGTADLTIRLDVEPTATVSIGLTSSDPDQCLVSPASIDLDAGNWSTGATAIVSAVADGVVDGDVLCTIVTSPDAATADSGYLDLDPPDVDFVILDDGVSVELQRLTVE